MLDQGLRTAILSLQAKGHGIRQIARALQISRGTVRTVLKTGNPTVPRIERAEKAEPHRAQILEWVDRCRGNLVRVHEELVAQGVMISYPALTAFCRRHAIGHAPRLAVSGGVLRVVCGGGVGRVVPAPLLGNGVTRLTQQWDG